MLQRLSTAAAIVVFCALLQSSCSFSPEAAKRKAYERGVKLYNSGQYAAASLEFRKAIQKDSEFGEAYLRLGLSESKQGQFQAADEAFNRAVALLPTNPEPKAQLAELYLTSYMADVRKPAALYRRISELTDQLLAKDPHSFAGLRLKGYMAAADNKPKDAIDSFQRAHQAKPDEPDVVAMLVQNLFRDGQSQAGESLALSFIQQHKTYAPLYDILYGHYRDAGAGAEAEKILKLKVANNPQSSLFVTQLCQHYWAAGKRDQVTPMLQNLAAHPGNYTNAYIDAGDFYAGIHEWASAIREYEAGLKAHPKEKLKYEKRLAGVYLSGGQPGDAERVLNTILQDDPGDTEARASRAALRVAKGTAGLSAAIDDFKLLLNKQPKNAEFAYQLGRAYELAGDEASAKAQYLSILQRYNNHVPSLLALAHMYLRQQRFEEAKRYADLVLAIDPRNPSARLVRTACLAAFGNYDATRTALDALIREYPRIEEAYLQLGLLDVLQKRYNEAEELFRTHYQAGQGDIRALKGIVEVYRSRKQWDKAIAIARAELDAHPQSPDIRRLLAETAVQAGKYDLAIEQYQNMARAGTASAIDLLQLGLAYEAISQFDAAIDQLRRAARMDPKNPLPPALLGRVLDEAKRLPEAIAAYRDSLRIDGENASVLNNLAFALAETNGDLDEAAKLARAALQRDARNAAFADTLGWIYLKRRDASSALHIFRDLSRKEPRNATFRIHLAMAFLASGDRESAHRELQAAQQLKTSGEEQAHIRELLAKT